ncbi:MAG: recombinase family protein [Tannerellaceae bacterium]|jgi:DNA invertase Pin-like site-specific DNA recombinase|nr:recombinase family protein [Tannerellaceae bacterium]
MIYGYIRVSTDKQTVENQRFEIRRYCESRGWEIDKWISETISGTKEVKKRKLGGLIKKLQGSDVLVCSEISRLGRSMFMILDVLKVCLEKGVTVQTIKDNYTLGPDPMSKLIASVYGFIAEMERNLISQRTKEGLKRRQSEGVRLGRQRGSTNSYYKLTGKEKEIKKMLSAGASKASMCRLYKVHGITLNRFIERYNLTE